MTASVGKATAATADVSTAGAGVARAAGANTATVAAVPAGEPRGFTRRHAGAIVVTGGLAGIVALFAATWLRGPQAATDRVVRRDFHQSVVVSGHVEAPHRVSIGASVVGTVRAVPVVEGQSVVAGQTLVELDASESSATRAQADAAVAQAQARVRQLDEVQAPLAEEALRQAEAVLANARAQAARATALLAQGFIGPAAMDETRKAVELAESQRNAARTQLGAARAAGSDRAVATSALAQSRAAAAVARARLGYATIVAPSAGTLIGRDVEPGDVVQPGKALMVLSPDQPAQLVVQVDEKNLRSLAIGQEAQASADAWPDRRVAARVAYINPGIDVQRGSVEVKLAVDAPPAYLRQDMTVSVDILVAARPLAVLVPNAALRDGAGAQAWVLRVDDGRARRRDVRLGLRGTNVSEVLSGLQPGDRVVTDPSLIVRDGARVRAHESPAASAATP